jgi:glutathione synthase/RimK-type ligase-like ATP-grasp enzyme
MTLLIYKKGYISGRSLAEHLGIRSMSNSRTSIARYGETVINYGNTARYGHSVREINPISSILNASNKRRALQLFADGGLPVPKMSEHCQELRFPIIGRKNNHTQGRDIILCLGEYDAKLAQSRGVDYFVEYLVASREYRYHVCNGGVLAMKKVLPREAEPKQYYIKNLKAGWVFTTDTRVYEEAKEISLKAVHSILQLDFGAVDLLHLPDGSWRILEVNTAPGLSDVSLEFYGENLSELI